MDEVLGHYRRYSEASLASRLEEAGFTVSRIAFQLRLAPGLVSERQGAQAKATDGLGADHSGRRAPR